MKRINYHIRVAAARFVYNHMESKAFVDEDIKHAEFKTLEKAITYLPFNNILYYRTSLESKWLCRILRVFSRRVTTMELKVYSGKLGKGFVVWLGYGTVIYCESIGDYCSVYQGVTIGRGKANADGRAVPVIGNHVNVFANAVVIGGINIGNNVDIGAGAVVTHDVPDNCVVAGVPAKIIKRKPNLT